MSNKDLKGRVALDNFVVPPGRGSCNVRNKLIFNLELNAQEAHLLVSSIRDYRVVSSIEILDRGDYGWRESRRLLYRRSIYPGLELIKKFGSL